MAYVRYRGNVRIRRAGRAYRLVRRRVGSGLTGAMVRRKFLRRAALYGTRATRVGLLAYGAYRAVKWARRRRQALRKCGNRPGFARCKTTARLDDRSIVSYSSRSLQQWNIFQIGAGGNIDDRQRDIVNVRGLKICLEIQNTTAVPIWIRMAIVIPKGSSTVSTTDFFRGYADARGTDFTVGSATGLNSNDLRCLPLNPDVMDIVWQHKIFLVGNTDTPSNETINFQWGSNYKTVDKYIPIKRQLLYDGSTISPNGRTPVFIMWGVNIIGNQGAAVANAYRMFKRFIIYWKEPKQT